MRPTARAMMPNAMTGIALLLLAACADATRVTAPPANAREPSALASKQSPTSGRILFTRERLPGIFSMDDDGTNVIEHPAPPGGASHPSWAPDGKRLIFAAFPGIGPLTIFLMDAAGVSAIPLTDPAPDQRDEMPRALAKRIVFVRLGDPTGTSKLMIMNEDGSGLTSLTNGPNDSWPAPSPSGKLVAFERNDDIYVIDVETRAVTNLTSSAAIEHHPSWSPGGKQIAFVRGTVEAPFRDIFVMNSDGTQITQLTNSADGQTATQPQWSPDGKRIAFVWYTGRYGIWAMNADGSALNDLSQSHPFFNEFVGAWGR